MFSTRIIKWDTSPPEIYYFLSVCNWAMYCADPLPTLQKLAEIFQPGSTALVLDRIRPLVPRIGIITAGNSRFVICQGTTTVAQHIDNYVNHNTSAIFPHAGAVHTGWGERAAEIRDEITPHLVGNTDTIFSGHSLGGSYAVLLHDFFVRAGFRSAACTFGGPRIGDPEFAASVAPVMLVQNKRDIVVKLPPRHPAAVVFLADFTLFERLNRYRHSSQRIVFNRDATEPRLTDFLDRQDELITQHLMPTYTNLVYSWIISGQNAHIAFPWDDVTEFLADRDEFIFGFVKNPPLAGRIPEPLRPSIGRC